MDAPTRVLHVLEATTGGTRRHLFDLVTRLDPARFAVHVVVSTRRDPGFLADLEALRARGLGVTVIPMTREIHPLRDAVALLRLRVAIRTARPDIVHTHSSKGGFLGRIAARLAGVPVVVHTPHVFAFQMAVGPLRRRLYLALERGAARLADRIICVCPAERAAAILARVAQPAQLVVIENGIAPLPPPIAAARAQMRSELAIRPDELVVGTVGRYTRQKGHADLLAAAPAVLQRHPRTRFVLAGAGELRPAIEAQIARLALGDHVLLVGAQEDAARFYPAFDVTVLPSLWEGLPYSLLEAMAAGAAVVATRVGGIPDVILSGKTGLLVPPLAPEALAQAIAALLADPALRARLGAAARALVPVRYAVDTMVRKTAELYAVRLAARRSG